ncbi:MAG: hypothetical protein ACJ75B_11940 [Flavisolibacter sp.]
MRKTGIGGLLLLGAAAFGAYKYSKMTDQQKKDLMNKGKKFVDDNLGGLKNMFGAKGDTQTAGGSYGTNAFSQA